jgi:hypothetical protein
VGSGAEYLDGSVVEGAHVFDLVALDDADAAAGAARQTEEDRQALRDRLNFGAAEPARPLWPRRPPSESDRTPGRPRSRRAEPTEGPEEATLEVDTVAARFDELAAAVEAIANRIGRGGRGEPVPVIEQLRRLAANQNVLQQEMHRITNRGVAPAPGDAARAGAHTDVGSSDVSGLSERVRVLESRLRDRDDLVETQLDVIGTQLASLQSSTSGAFVPADVDALRGRLDRVSAELVALRGEVRASLERSAELAATVAELEPGIRKLLDAIHGLEPPRPYGGSAPA